MSYVLILAILSTNTNMGESPMVVGEWQAEYIIESGKVLPDKLAVLTLWEFSEKKVKKPVIGTKTEDGVITGVSGINRYIEMPYSLNTKGKPWTIDFVASYVPYKALQGIIKIEKDFMMIYAGEVGKPRPTAFPAKEDVAPSYQLIKFNKKPVNKKKDNK